MKIHFIGIGGIGVSALARYFLAQGAQVSGSDVARNETTEELEKRGVKIFLGHGADNLTRFNLVRSDLLIYSAAVQENNPELIEARKRGIKCQTYAQALGELTKKYFTIAVSGTHGKSTTTAMIGLILEAAGLDPTVIVGTKVKWKIPHPNPLLNKEREKSASNFRLGYSKYLVIEADEYAASFLN
jgi:UDP-N-acetylmuramate--alanine ligase